MMPKRRNHDRADFTANVALAAMKGQHTVNELATRFGVPPHQVLPWKKQALEARPEACSARRGREAPDEEAFKGHLYQQRGQLKGELAWLKKKVGFSA